MCVILCIVSDWRIVVNDFPMGIEKKRILGSKTLAYCARMCYIMHINENITHRERNYTMTTSTKQSFIDYSASVRNRIVFKQRGSLAFALVPASAPVYDPYMVKLDRSNAPVWCDCKAFTYNHSKPCKHMQAVSDLIETIERERAIDALLEEINMQDAQCRSFADAIENSALTSSPRVSTVAPVSATSSEKNMARLGLMR
jgi:hypothetical protein